MSWQLRQQFFVTVAAIVHLTLALGATSYGQGPGRPKTIAVDLGKGMKLDMVSIPAGAFMMGSPDSEKDRQSDEGPQRRVRLTNAFYLGVYEVTRGQFRQFVNDTGYKTDAEKSGGSLAFDGRFWVQKREYTWQNAGFEQTDDHPVVNVSWNDATAFCDWLRRRENKRYCLPTEAQWEYACRAGATTVYSSGDDAETLAQVGNVADAVAKAKFPNWTTIKASDGYVFTAPVGQFKPNAWGLYDMHGNVLEWCSDWYESNYYTISPADDPGGFGAGSYHVNRGGCWCYSARFCRAAYRINDSPGYRCNALGFRVSLAQ